MDSGDKPEGIVVESRSDVGVAPLGQRLILVIGAAVRKLGCGDVQNAASCPVRNQMDKAQQILAGVPEAHAAAETAFVIAGAPAHIKGYHALVLVPDIHQPVQTVIGRGDCICREKMIPVAVKLRKRKIHLGIGPVFREKPAGRRLVDDIRLFKFFFRRIFTVSQNKDGGPAFPRGENSLQVVGADGSPAVDDTVRAVSLGNSLGIVESPVEADEGVSCRVKSFDIPVDRPYRIVIAPLPVFRLMVNGTVLHLHFAGGEIPLEIGGIIHGIPKTEFHQAEDVHSAVGIRAVGENKPVYLTVIPEGNKGLQLRLQPVLFALDNGVSQAVTAAVAVQFGLNRLPSGIPYRIPVLYIEIASALIGRSIVVAVSCQTEKLGIPVKGISAGGIRDQTEKIRGSEIINPW